VAEGEFSFSSSSGTCLPPLTQSFFLLFSFFVFFWLKVSSIATHALPTPVKTVLLKLVQQIELRFFCCDLYKENNEFKRLHDYHGLVVGKPRDNASLANPAVLAAVLFDPHLARVFLDTTAFADLGLVAAFDSHFASATAFINAMTTVPAGDNVAAADGQGAAAADEVGEGILPWDSDDDSNQFAPVQPALAVAPMPVMVQSELQNYVGNVRSLALSVAASAAYLAEPSGTARSYNFWSAQRRTRLALCALVVGNIRCSSATVERQASVAGLIDTSKRHRLNPTMFEILSFIAENQALLPKDLRAVTMPTYAHARSILTKGCASVRADGADVVAADADVVVVDITPNAPVVDTAEAVAVFDKVIESTLVAVQDERDSESESDSDSDKSGPEKVPLPVALRDAYEDGGILTLWTALSCAAAEDNEEEDNVEGDNEGGDNRDFFNEG
jgi:hypothetical protein